MVEENYRDLLLKLFPIVVNEFWKYSDDDPAILVGMSVGEITDDNSTEMRLHKVKFKSQSELNKDYEVLIDPDTLKVVGSIQETSPITDEEKIPMCCGVKAIKDPSAYRDGYYCRICGKEL